MPTEPDFTDLVNTACANAAPLPPATVDFLASVFGPVGDQIRAERATSTRNTESRREAA